MDFEEVFNGTTLPAYCCEPNSLGIVDISYFDLIESVELLCEDIIIKKALFRLGADSIRNCDISQISSVSTQLAASYNSASLVTNMLGMSAANTSDLNMFFGSDLTSIKTLYSATLTVQKEARALAAEIRLDKIRGVDTSDKEAKLANLNDSVSFLDKSITSKIDNALADKNTSSDSRSVIDKIKDELEANQKKLDKEFGNTTDDDDEKEVEEKDESTEKEVDNRPIIDRINDGLAENQKKLDEEFSSKA